MTEMKLRRGKASPKKGAADFTATGKDKDGFDVKYISSDKGRGVFSCVHFNKGDFLVEYRGQLINILFVCDHIPVYHDALKVFMFEFRFNGKLLCVDAAREDGSLGRLVNDDHINPNSNMKIITVKGKPHLCLIATRSINPGEEITYNYGDSEWPWRSKVLCYDTILQTASEKHQLQPQEMSTTSSEAVSEADPFTPTTAVTLEAIKQRQQNEPGTVPEVTTPPRVVTDKSETVVPTEDTEKNEAGTVPEVRTSPRVVTDKSETVVPTEDTEKIAVVKEQSGSEGQETIGTSEKTAKSGLVLLLRSAQACHFSRLEILMLVLEVNLRMGVKVRIWRLAGVHHCRSVGMWKDQAPKEDEAGAVVQGNVAAEAGNSRKRTRTPWSKREEVAVMKYFKSHITKGKLATMAECLQCKTAEDPVLAGCTAQNIRDFVRNGNNFKKESPV
ncbi:hypothetical protein QTP70_014507 [Hemibagrus guttatus]|uniref:SET domain-containing protein n=1 Tax=Hemibagrus guttatus TaxID=175788 RepID=A0AAE0R1E4_9TELE|nr:hypothetical protein QTP70_014507 [Hemibagrus guttatus]